MEGLFPTTLTAPYNEVEQDLRVVAFNVPGQQPVDVALLPGGTGTVTRTTVTGGTLRFNFTGGAFTSGTYTPAIDYNERTPFAATDLFSYIVSDNGRTTLPGSGYIRYLGSSTNSTITIAEQRSAEATVTLNVTQTNDPPIFTMPNAFRFSENDGASVVSTDFVTGVAPSALTALDELQRQDVTFTFAAINVPAGLMTALPTVTVSGRAGAWPGTGTLTVFPAADAFGFAVYSVTATDSDPTNPRTTVSTITITIDPVNDVPVAYPRSLTVSEAVEADSQTAVLTFTAAQLLNGTAPELPAVEGLFPTTLAAPYNEVEQTLRVVEFNVPGQPAVDVSSLTGGTGVVTRTTVTGGTLRFNFTGGAFTSGTYTPAIDYNERTPFAATDLFSYIVSDNGRTTLPGSGFTRYLGRASDSTITIPEQRSAEATITLNVTQSNDAPIFTMPTTLTFDENAGTAVVSTNLITGVAPSALTALDELQRQGVTFSVSPVNVPAGMMTAIPTVTVNGTAGNWPGVATLTVFPAADAFGFAVYAVTATDDDASNPRTTTKTITIAVNPVNDAPVAFPRSLSVTEAVERDGQTAVLTFTAAGLLRGSGLELPAVEGAFPSSLNAPYNEVEQNLRVVAFAVPGQPVVDVSSLTGGSGTVSRTTNLGAT